MHAVRRKVTITLASLLAFWFAGGFAGHALAQTPARPTSAEVPWPVVLGQRTAALERDWKIVDQVVLVPDERTYLDELAKWSAEGRWPVLIEDGF